MAIVVMGPLSDEERQERACGDKINFISHTRAMLTMKTMIAAGEGEPGLTSYDCRYCGGVHIGSTFRSGMVRRLWHSCRKLSARVAEMFHGEAVADA